MILRGIDFGDVLGGSGAQGFFGEGYWYHSVLKRSGFLDLSGMTFVAKTATLKSRKGNMPLRNSLKPKKLIPKCIKVNYRKGMILNAVGVSNPGILALLDDGRWQKKKKPLFYIHYVNREYNRADGADKENRWFT